ncbi:MAG: hypothetical protein KJ674_01595 [Nanoarchaeota archaeon]|nr:hypothetical protein [Nanoarchaeota archaeon]
MFRPNLIRNVYDHTMENYIYKYLKIKMHHYILERDFDNIFVIGIYDRNVSISKYEKKGKLFNWQRPTAEIKNNTLYIKCPSGSDYVMHYASLIATYLAVNNRKFDHVFYNNPSIKENENLILNSNLKEIKPKEIVVIGYGLEAIAGRKNWLGKGSFLYKNSIDKNVTFIGCKHSIWGDIAGRVTSFLANLGVKTVIYIGKLGSINPDYNPNESLATGNVSLLNGKFIVWDNLFNKIKDPILKRGNHYTSSSTILETKEWIKKNSNFDFVDPEIGYMAKAANESGINFSYLHIISSNLSQIHHENLSNERSQTILNKRKNLLLKIRNILYKEI